MRIHLVLRDVLNVLSRQLVFGLIHDAVSTLL